MSNINTLFLLSNRSSDTYPNNTLTKFTNKLPAPIDLESNTKYEVAVESIGFSCLL